MERRIDTEAIGDGVLHQKWHAQDMQKWEYRIWQYENGSGVENMRKEWEALGEEGFEFITERTSFYIFKRPKPQEAGLRSCYH